MPGPDPEKSVSSGGLSQSTWLDGAANQSAPSPDGCRVVTQPAKSIVVGASRRNLLPPLWFGVFGKEMAMAKVTQTRQQNAREEADLQIEGESKRRETAFGGEEREERIRTRAYQLWEAAGRPEGQQQAHWEQASRDIDAEDDLHSGNRVI
jgi:hypothetical protein